MSMQLPLLFFSQFRVGLRRQNGIWLRGPGAFDIFILQICSSTKIGCLWYSVSLPWREISVVLLDLPSVFGEQRALRGLMADSVTFMTDIW